MENTCFTSGQGSSSSGSAFFEELINLISLLIDSKLLDLLLKSKTELNEKFARLQSAIDKQSQFFEKLDEVDELVSDLLESEKMIRKEERAYGNMPAPWDEYSVQVLKF